MKKWQRILTILALLCMLIPFAAVGVNAATGPVVYATVVDTFRVPLPGAKLNLYSIQAVITSDPGRGEQVLSERPASSQPGTFIGVYTADEQGIVTFAELQDGMYAVTMTEGIDGCEPCPDIGNFAIRNGALMNLSDDTALWTAEDPFPFVCKRESNFRYIVPIFKTVELDGDKLEPGAKTFTFNATADAGEVNFTYESNTIETNGQGTYEGEMVIVCPTMDDYYALAEGIVVREAPLDDAKDTNGEWTMGDVYYRVLFLMGDVGLPSVGLVDKYVDNQLVPFDKVDAVQDVAFVNTYVSKKPAEPQPPLPTQPPVTPPAVAPETADSALLGVLSLLLAGGAVVFVTHRRKTH